ncbi:Nif3-like dinuclear metal center hexameric protein [Luteolibacter flavescens]|uniref:Nif3-like dinuclear metal center hexameric protein n=1 Tax=Luteolibacter flavescens TaxID=1859460 RepID=A0ABT3FNI1_9BACT|nr:Nif3-like dinuclear metal center hexameric protein [Luteolibacter flavescens]MCW1884894.1 Nif3-like dinuclear metal center hexameric protein [Luteolibacter flavescens]
MASLHEIVAFLDGELGIPGIPDYSGAVNGLQLENGGSVTKVAAAVDASLPVVEAAVAAGADLLVVHHGMFWQGTQPLTRAFYKKIKTAMDAGLAIYSAHLPLDVHPVLGNNALLAAELGLEVRGKFLEWKNLQIGLLCRARTSRDALKSRLEEAVGGPVHVCPGGPEDIRVIGLCTGGAGSQIAEAAAAGVDTFITGEGPHWSYPLAEELGVNLFYAGHYATETFGVKALADRLARDFALEQVFIDHPTGL